MKALGLEPKTYGLKGQGSGPNRLSLRQLCAVSGVKNPLPTGRTSSGHSLHTPNIVMSDAGMTLEPHAFTQFATTYPFLKFRVSSAGECTSPAHFRTPPIYPFTSGAIKNAGSRFARIRLGGDIDAQIIVYTLMYFAINAVYLTRGPGMVVERTINM